MRNTAPFIELKEDTAAPALAMCISHRLEEYGIGLQSAFAALVGSATGVGPSELQAALSTVFNIGCPEELAQRFVAWGDISGGGRLRYVEFGK